MSEEITLVGIGQAGGNLLLDFLRYREYTRDVEFNAVYFNSNEHDHKIFMENYSKLRRKRRKFQLIHDVLYASAVRRGIGGNFILSELLLTDFLENRMADELKAIFARSKAVIIFHSLAGGTGGGGASVLARWIREHTGGLVLPFSVLHGSRIKGERRYKFNTLVNLISTYMNSDIIFLFDNGVISTTLERNRIKTAGFDPRNMPIVRVADTLLAPSFLDSYPVFDFADLQNLLYVENGFEIKTVFPEIFPLSNEPTTAGIGRVVEDAVSMGGLCTSATPKKLGLVIVSNNSGEVQLSQANTYINIVNRLKNGDDVDVNLYLSKFDRAFKSALLLNVGFPPIEEYLSEFNGPADFADEISLYIKRVRDTIDSAKSRIAPGIYADIKEKYCDFDVDELSNYIWDKLNTLGEGDSSDA
jgi:cell division GTPase FtsZ